MITETKPKVFRQRQALAELVDLLESAIVAGVTAPTVEQMVRHAAVSAAQRNFTGAPTLRLRRSTSAIAAATGLSRKEVKRIRDLGIDRPETRLGALHRIVDEWDRRHSIYKAVTHSEFYDMARVAAHDIPPRALLRVLLFRGEVKHVANRAEFRLDQKALDKRVAWHG